MGRPWDDLPAPLSPKAGETSPAPPDSSPEFPATLADTPTRSEAAVTSAVYPAAFLPAAGAHEPPAGRSVLSLKGLANARGASESSRPGGVVEESGAASTLSLLPEEVDVGLPLFRTSLGFEPGSARAPHRVP